MRSALCLAALTVGLAALAISLLPLSQHSITLAFTGDIMLGRGVAQGHPQGTWHQALAILAPCTTSADLAIANLESPLTTAHLIRETYDLRAPFDARAALSDAGIDVSTLANNHTADAGDQGLDDTIRALREAGIAASHPSDQPWFATVGDLDIALFAFDDVLQPLDVQQAGAMVAEIQGKADLTIVSIHWGNELERQPNERQKLLAANLAASGADIIVGHHPHVLQPIEWLWGAGRGRPTLVAYSLGNTLFDQAAPPSTRDGALLLIHADSAGAYRVCAFPFQIDPRTWDTTLAHPAAAARIAQSLGISCIVPAPCKLNTLR